MRGWITILLVGCAMQPQPQPQPQPQSTHKKPRELDQELRTSAAKVVPAEQAERSGLVESTLRTPFEGGADGTRLVEELLARADASRVELIADLAIYLQTRDPRDGRAVECRSSIVPETLTVGRTIPEHYEQVSVSRPVSRTVTENEYRCKPVTKYENRAHTESQQKCGSVTRPVTRTRTAYRSQYDSYSKSYRQVPYTETYTAYESRYECRSEPVTRYKMEAVSRTECSSHLVTKSVTRYEFQFETRFVPARLETITRQRLRELDPECYAVPVGGPPSAALMNRIEGRAFTKRAR
ncbi:MAG: hypothetical protein M4D80_24615 [Myxococcota bacterium]|nr:hypothetical protein [Deltaproteobacteria bacterium]MDQ3338362.1 hypothetical protein [Myxococcota bacterium]